MLRNPPAFSRILEPYKSTIEEKIAIQLKLFGNKTTLRDACEYALLNGGKRFRPALVLMIAKALGFEADVSLAALGVEFFHTASLVADDLPCMDNDEERRNAPTLHRVYGESVALLTTYALIAAGYECLTKNGQLIKQSSLPFAYQGDQLCVLALENATFNTGILGATGGQFLDIYPPNLSLEAAKEVIHKKTISLFEISFVLGWLFGGGDLSQMPLVKKGAEHFGLAFQIADDLEDQAQDQLNQRFINLANLCGKEAAQRLFYTELQLFEAILLQLGLESEDLRALLQFLVYRVEGRKE